MVVQPMVLSASVVILKLNGTKLSLNCLPNEKYFDYLWEKRDGDLPSRAGGVHSSQMTVVDLMPEDSGEYRCMLSNSTGTVSSAYFSVAIQGMACMALQHSP